MPSTPLQGSTSSNVYLNAIQWKGWHWTDDPSPGANITYYFNPAGANLDPYFDDGYGNSQTWTSTEMNAYRAALQTWANVANITFTEVFSYAQANLAENVFNSSSGPLGIHETPEDAFTYSDAAWGAYNRAGDSFTTSGIAVGGDGFITLVHEIGHGLGLAHPHGDTGSTGVFPGVSDSADRGDNDLNQGIFTIMSYNNGWATGPAGNQSSLDFGWEAGPMAFDIAAIQFLYGANTSFHSGNNTYLLPDNDAPGTYWISIWDAGGVDQIVYNGARDAVISLVAATLDDSPTGGGVPSYAATIHGGFTIANGVVIENATGGSGNDTITGNSAANLLLGNGGDDVIDGGPGSDVLDGGNGHDTVDYSTASGAINVDLSVSAGSIGGIDTDTLLSIEGVIGSAFNDIVVGTAGANNFTGGAGSDYFYGRGGDDQAFGGGGVDVLLGEGGADTLHGGDDTDYLFGADGSNTLFGDGGVDVLYAQGTSDIMYGGDGGDYFYPLPGAVLPLALGADGNDIYTDLSGGSNDTFYGEAGQDYCYGFGGDDQFYGGDGVDVYLAGDGNDTFDGGAGVDYAWGEAGNDTFITRPANGALVLTGFTAGGTDDAVKLEGTGLTDLAQALGAMTYFDGLDTTILTIDSDTNVWFIGLQLGQFTAADFFFA